jgi:ankyrin repeat protein
MRLRFALIRRCKEAVFARSRRKRMLRGKGVASLTSSGTSYDPFEGPSNAFKTFSVISHPTTHISTELTTLSMPMLDRKAAYNHGNSTNHRDSTDFNISRNLEENGISPLILPDELRSGPQITEEASHESLLSKPVSHQGDVGNLQALLVPARSESYVVHVKSVMFESDSRRSSIVLEETSISPKRTSTQLFGDDESETSGRPLSNGEEAIWNDLVDETQLDCTSHSLFGFASVPSYEGVSMTGRKCCEMPDVGNHDFICGQCGFTQVHYFAILSLGRVLRRNDSVNRPDHFGNTPLHCAVATGEMNVTGLLHLIDMGADVQAVNSFGETFLHLIRSVPLKDTAAYVFLLNYLASLNFPFTQRDHHGRTFLHTLLEQPEDKISGITGDILRDICHIVKPDLKAMDNRGYTILRPSVSNLRWRGFVTLSPPQHVPLPESLSPDNLAMPVAHDWQEKWTMPKTGEIGSWLAKSNVSEPLTWIDGNGDTVLNAILKLPCWNKPENELRLRDTVKELISLGAQLHMRDANGDTSLAIATKRGFRPALTVLLEAGANPNTRNYRGTAILSQATLAMLSAAKDNNERLDAMIQSCFTLLVDSGAKAEPTQLEEWLTYPTKNIQF